MKPLAPVPITVIAALLLAAMLAFPFIVVLDHVNLVFHEAGHVIFRLLGDTASLYGGTLGQFVFPTLAAVSFWRRGEITSVAICALWFCENLRYMAVYMADARAQVLPLVGGGEHDWTNIFSRWGVLQHDTIIAGFFTALSVLGMVAICAFAWYQWAQQRRTSGDDARALQRQQIAERARERHAQRQGRSPSP